MILIFSPPRCGSTKLCYELSARAPMGDSIINEPACPNKSSRREFGSTYSEVGVGGLRKWLLQTQGISGIKMLAAKYDWLIDADHGRWCVTNLDIFDKVILLNRDPVEISISLEIARATRSWNIISKQDKERDESVFVERVKVQDGTLKEVDGFLTTMERMRAELVARDLPFVELNFLDSLLSHRIEEVATFCSFEKYPMRQAVDVEPVRSGPTARGTIDMCENLEDIKEYFMRRLTKSSCS